MRRIRTCINFQKDFLWGSSTSGPQTEGRLAQDGKGDNLWDYWYRVRPNRFYQGQGPEKTSTFYEHWEEDLDLLLETATRPFELYPVVTYFPRRTREINQAGVDFYRRVFEKIKRKRDSPSGQPLSFWFTDGSSRARDGWENKETAYAYQEYARFCFKTYGDLVDQWITFNEPIVPVEFGYFYDAHFPHKVDSSSC